MAVTDNYLPVQFAGNGSTSTFDFSWIILEDTHIKLIHTDTGDTDTTPVLDTDYSVSGVNDTNGGTVTFPISGSSYSTLSSGETLTIYRETELAQSTDLYTNGAWDPEVVETALDRLTLYCQELQEQLDRATLADMVDTY